MKIKTLPDGKKIIYDDEAEEIVVIYQALGEWEKLDKNGMSLEAGTFTTITPPPAPQQAVQEINLFAAVNGNEAFTIPLNTVVKKHKAQPVSKKPKEVELDKIKMADLYTYQPLSKYTGLEGKIAVRADTTYVGVEIELEKVVIGDVPSSTWKVTEDNSLKDKGVEFVTIPIHFRYLEVELQRLFSGLKNSHASTRCSVHVHLNARDFTLEELKSFIALYMIFEKSLYHFSGGRWNNNFCVPLYFSPHIVRSFVTHINETKTLPDTWYKYFGFNMCPLYGGESQCIGTVEFRHMKGNTNVEWIVNWINLIVSLKISAKKFTFEEIVRHLEVMNTTSGYYWLAKEVFREFEAAITTQPTFKEDIESCITQTKTIFLSTKPGSEVLN